VKLPLLVAAGALGVWLVRRGRRANGRRVAVAWEDGSELELGVGSAEGERLVGIAGKVLR
jgi:hypothetical protein